MCVALLHIAAALALTVFYFCSLDAINPGFPHHRGNVQWTCLRINLGERGCCAHMFAIALTHDAGKQLFPDVEFRDWARRALRFVGLPVTTLADISVMARL